MPSKDKYSDPKLRDEVKEELKQSDKGGEPGQWSARKVSTFLNSRGTFFIVYQLTSFFSIY